MGMNIKGFAFVTKCARFSRVRNSRTVMYIDILIMNKIPPPVSQTLCTLIYWPSSTYLINNSFWLVFCEFHKGNFTNAFNAYACIFKQLHVLVLNMINPKTWDLILLFHCWTNKSSMSKLTETGHGILMMHVL